MSLVYSNTVHMQPGSLPITLHSITHTLLCLLTIFEYAIKVISYTPCQNTAFPPGLV